ncbi:hypothetical protein MG293_017032 [Ovis ammon polii]|uniref:Uncharacterized protein n=1 Tax=Ovis ammon polii TaxID=230172 RepID=A0AAD4TUR4_OVIAM|nr:hypothetical protein MG293_017032 [Ovis ammon polii]
MSSCGRSRSVDSIPQVHPRERLKILLNDSGIGLRKAAAVILIHTQLVQTWTSTPDRERSEPCLTLRVEYQHGLRTAALERALLCQRKLSLLNSNPTGNRASLNRHGDLAYGGAARSSESSQYGSARKPRDFEIYREIGNSYDASALDVDDTCLDIDSVQCWAPRVPEDGADAGAVETDGYPQPSDQLQGPDLTPPFCPSGHLVVF